MKTKLLLISLFATSTFAAVPSDIKKQQHDLKCRHIEHIYDWTIQMAGSTGYLDAVSNMPINIRNAQFNKMMNSKYDFSGGKNADILDTLVPASLMGGYMPPKRKESTATIKHIGGGGGKSGNKKSKPKLIF